MAVKGANDRRGTCVNRSNEGSRGLGLVGLREEGLCSARAPRTATVLSAPAIIALCRW